MGQVQILNAAVRLLPGTRATAQRPEHDQSLTLFRLFSESRVRASRSMRARAPAFPAVSRTPGHHARSDYKESRKGEVMKKFAIGLCLLLATGSVQVHAQVGIDRDLLAEISRIKAIDN